MQQIVIYRIYCPACGTTHALIPSFSLPGTSHDRCDVELYLYGREQSLSRMKAGAHILKWGFEIRVLKRLEKAFDRALERWSVLFCETIHSGMKITAVASALGFKRLTGVLNHANAVALSRNINAIFNSRSSILLFTNHRTGKKIPHTVVAWQVKAADLNSS